jgi:hypothetical protein
VFEKGGWGQKGGKKKFIRKGGEGKNGEGQMGEDKAKKSIIKGG